MIAIKLVMATELANKKAEREALRGVIQQWNANRLDLFELSEPNEDLEFHGVMRFYFQDSGQKVATKCIRVASDATSQAVIETLIEKFRPDMRMLSVPEYALYEIHENGEERKLGLEEKPLLVQLNWHIDDREGRFLLRRIDDKTNAQGVGFSSSDGSSFRRKLSKREKKQMKKQEKLSRLKSLEQDENSIPVDQNGVAEKLYTELPETSFTRSISNPEAVMRRRRQQKLERKLQQFRSKDGGPDTGGTLKIYGEALCKDVPYKTLLLSVRDSAVQVVREMLSKYGLEKVDPQQYCLVQVNSENNLNGGTQQEYILDDDECPLAILMNHSSTRGSIMFHVRRRPSDYVPRKRKKKPSGKWNELDCRYEDERLPFLLELNPDGSEIPNGAGVRHRLQPNVTEVGSERPIGPQAVQAQTLTLTGPTVMPRHCVIAFTENIVTLTPCSRDAYTYVNNQRIHQTTILQNGAIVKFGRLHTFKFIDPTPDERIRQRHDSGKQIEYNYDRLLLYRRRSPDLANQETNMEKYGTVSGTSNNGQNQVQIQSQSIQDQIIHSSSPNKSTPIPAAAVTVCHTRSPTHALESTHNYETTFDLDGNVETASLTSSRDGNRTLQNDRQPRGTDPILPAVLEFLEETEETFFHAVITDVEPSAPQFKLAPTYTLYLAARYRASTHFRPELQPTERAHRLTVMLANVASMIQRVIQERYMDASSLALWLANGSELLHMLKNDRHVGAFSTRAQDILTEAVHTAFASLVRCISLELAPAMSQFMADADEPAKEAGVLQIFSSTMALLRRCRVNAALTIQLFSHLFHTINATTFNALVSNTNLCVRWFGRRLKARLNALETWAERQGLELASQCHLATIMQATHLLQAPKYNAEELATLSSTCFKLNSLQVRALLQKYQPAADEPRLPAELIENVVRVAESVADTLARADGREIRLEEEPTLALALLLPEDGYSCEVIRGVPPGLAEFLAPLQRDGLCRMASQPTSSGYWTIYMIDHHNNFRSPSAMSNRSGGYSCHAGSNIVQPEIHIIKLHKSTNGMGLSIVAAKGAGQDRLGIYIKSVVTGGAADADGRLTAGDQLLKVDGQSLVGITQEKAAEYLVRTGPIVTLEVAKQGAIYHGLATLLSQPSPVMNRAYKIRPKSESLEASTAQEMNEQSSTSHSMGNLLNVPRHAIDLERSIDSVPDSNSDSSATVNNKCNSFSLDSIPYIDQVDEISSVPFSSNQFQLELDKYQLENNNRVVIKRYDSQLINEEGQIANRYERGEASSYKQEKYTKTNKQANKYNMAKQQEKNDEIKERKVKDILLSPYVILNNNDDFEIFISKAKADMFNIPVLNLDLSGLDSNTTYDVSSFNKCWKSPEEDWKIYPRSNRTHLNLDFFLRSRRMSERDLPSRLGRDITAPQQQMHISKSVPALHNVGTDGKQQHEVFNPGYSRASSSNSVTPPVTQPPPPMATISGSTSLRSRSSHNLHDSTRIGTLSSNGLVTRQQSSPNLNPDHTSNHNDTNVNGGTNSNILQGNEVERFYQNLSIYRNQDATTKQHNPSQHLDDRTPLQLQKNLRGSQNSLNRPGVFEMNQTRDRPISSYVPQPQQQSYIDNTGQSQQQACTAPPRSQSSRDIIRQEAKLQEMQEEVRRRELRGGISVPLNQYRPSTYNLKTNTSVQSSISSVVRPTKSIGSQPNLGSSPPITISTSVSTSRQTGPSSYNYLDAQYGSYMVQYGKSSHTHQHQSQSQSQHQHSHQHQLQLQHQYQHQHQHQHQHHNIQQQNFGHIQYGHVGMLSSRGKNDLTRMQLNGTLHDYGRDQNIRDIGKLYTDQNQHVAGSQYCLNSNPEIQNEFYNDENGINRMQTAPEGTSISNEIPIRPILPEEGFTESSPPPPPSTSTHPLYNKQSDSRYTASMQDPPRGGYYPTNTTGTTLQPRQYQYSASNPWQREEKEREQARRREAARQWRDQQIAELSALSHRTSQQEEQLRALQLERDFQKRAEEIANQQDDDEESNDLDTENIRVQQSLFQTTVMQDRNNSLEQHSNLSKTNVTNQSSKGNHFSRSLGGSPMHSMNVVTTHGNNTLQQCTQNITTTCLQQQQQQQDNSSSLLSSDFQHQHTNQMQNNIGQISMPSLIHLTSSQKSLGLSQSNEEKEMHRRHEEIKRKQIDFDDTQLKKEEETNKQQQMYQQQHHSQQSQSHLKTQQLLHSNMLRLDSLIINGSNASPTQNGINDAPLPPERGSSFAVMSQQNTLRSNNANISNIILASQPQTTSVKRVSFHDSNANVESIRNISSGNLSTNQTMTMDAITEDPNNFINDAEILLASPKTPEGSGGTSITGSTPGVIGAQEVYKDPRQKRLAEKQKQQQSSQVGQVPEKLSFKEKMKMFAMETGEDGTPRDKVKISRAQREIDNIGNPVLNSNYYNNSNNSIINTSNSNIQNNNNGNSINNNNSNRQQ
ncbi:putative uncharacterized protein DDB_G0282133 isoform X9 [Apis mellifera]|uniref:Afadin n=1 Tax=Apis mellifera TaxID=7460 RepID=A0A7M7IN00_APIME|nr:putative uncharacterized protein DDB_G0282133 isoform X9 [Apis mellifera]|eukprot:XP_016772689.2 putative uncharacterized protein DDB_G0282133 isoform X9 [Apis mellifera]